MTQTAARPVDVERAVHILRCTCQSHGSSASANGEDIASLVPSAALLAQQCTPALLSSVLEACDATTPVAGAPKKLAMLNAAWKLLLAIAACESVQHDHYETALLHMIEQLRWGVLTHDWGDKKRVRLATFFASHIVLAVRAHPQLLLTGTEAARAFLGHLVHLYFAVCVTVATSTRDSEAVATLYDNIVVRLHGIFECLGAAAAGAAESEGNEEGGGEVQTACSALEEVLSHCVCASAALEVAEAAGGGPAVQQAAATAALGAYLHVVRGVTKSVAVSSGSSGGSEETDAAATRTSGASEEDGAGPNAEGKEGSSETAAALTPRLPFPTLRLLAESVLAWLGRHRSDHGDGETSLTNDALSPAGAAVVRDARVLAGALSSAALSPHNSSEPSPAASQSATLRCMLVATLTCVWQQWVALCAAGAPHTLATTGSSLAPLLPLNGDASAVSPALSQRDAIVPRRLESLDAASQAECISSMILSLVMGEQHSSAIALIALEAWGGLLRQMEAEAATASLTAASSAPHLAAVGVVMRILCAMRCTATELVTGLLSLREAGLGADAASTRSVLTQAICSVVALIHCGEAAIGSSTHVAEGEECVADAVVSALLEVFRAQAGAPLAGSDDSASTHGSPACTPSSGVADELRSVLLAVQQEFKALHKRAADDGPARFPLSLCQLLVQVPRRLQSLIRAFAPTAPAASRVDSDGATSGQTGTDQQKQELLLKQSLLSCSSLLAALTQTLQSFTDTPSVSLSVEAPQADQARLLSAHASRARVARWVAARLVYEMAAIPITDGADDAVLLACVRRWTDVAFSNAVSQYAGAAGSAGGSHSNTQECGEAVLLANSASALLRIAEECTTLDLGTLNLSESATTALMDLVEGESQDGEDTAGLAQWRAVEEEERRQWAAMQAWLKKESAALALQSSSRAEGAVLPGDGGQCMAEDTASQSLLPLCESPTASQFLRCLQYCESVLQQLRDCTVATSTSEGEGELRGKRRRLDEGAREDMCEPAAPLLNMSEEESTGLTAALSRIHQLSSGTLAHLGGVSSGALLSSSLPASGLPQVAEESEGSDAPRHRRRHTQVFTLSDTESMASRHPSSYTEVIDIE